MSVIPESPFSAGTPVSAGVLNAMAEVCNGIRNVSSGDGVSAEYVGNTLQIKTEKGEQFYSDLQIGVVTNTGLDAVYAGEFLMVEGSMHSEEITKLSLASNYPHYLKGGGCDFSDDDLNHTAGDFVVMLDAVEAGGSGKCIIGGFCLAYIELQDINHKYVSVNDFSYSLISRESPNAGEIIWQDNTLAVGEGEEFVPDYCWAIIKFGHLDKSNLKIVYNDDPDETTIPPFSAMEVVSNDGRLFSVQKPSEDNLTNILFTEYSWDGTGLEYGYYAVVNTKFANAEIDYSPEESLPTDSFTYGTEADSFVMKLGRIGYFSNRTWEETVDSTTTPYASFNTKAVLPVTVEATGDIDTTDPDNPIIEVKAVGRDGTLIGDAYDIAVLP